MLPTPIVDNIQRTAWGITWRRWLSLDDVTRIHIAVGLDEWKQIPFLLGNRRIQDVIAINPNPSVDMNILINQCGWTMPPLAPLGKKKMWIRLIVKQCSLEIVQRMVERDTLVENAETMVKRKDCLEFISCLWGDNNLHQRWPDQLIDSVVYAGNISLLCWMFREKPDQSYQSYRFKIQPLVNAGHLEMLKYLSDNNMLDLRNQGIPNLHATSLSMFEWLYDWMKSNHMFSIQMQYHWIVPQLLEAGQLAHLQFLSTVEPDLVLEEGQARIVMAIKSGNVAMAQWVYENIPNCLDGVILHWKDAFRHPNPQLVSAMIQWMLETFHLELPVFTPAHIHNIIVATNDVQIVELVHRVYKLDPTETLSKHVTLQYVINAGCDHKMVEYLLDHGVRPEIMSSNDLCRYGSVDIVRVLLQRADVHFHHSPSFLLVSALEHHTNGIFRFLLQHLPTFQWDAYGRSHLQYLANRYEGPAARYDNRCNNTNNTNSVLASLFFSPLRACIGTPLEQELATNCSYYCKRFIETFRG